MIDLIIISYAKDESLKQLTNNCLISLLESEEIGTFNIIIVESNPLVRYDLGETIHINEPFNYNKFGNTGIKLGSAEYVCLCNNDLIFHKGWASELIKNDLPSMSPKCPKNPLQWNLNKIHLGFETNKHISGWCLFLKRHSWESIGGFDEDFEFWCADDSYREQLKKHNINHYLIATSLVTHLGHQTIEESTPEEIKFFTFEQVKKYNKKYNRNLFGLE